MQHGYHSSWTMLHAVPILATLRFMLHAAQVLDLRKQLPVQVCWGKGIGKGSMGLIWPMDCPHATFLTHGAKWVWHLCSRQLSFAELWMAHPSFCSYYIWNCSAAANVLTTEREIKRSYLLAKKKDLDLTPNIRLVRYKGDQNMLEKFPFSWEHSLGFFKVLNNILHGKRPGHLLGWNSLFFTLLVFPSSRSNTFVYFCKQNYRRNRQKRPIESISLTRQHCSLQLSVGWF